MELYNHSLFNDSTLKAYYRFESGALTTDSKGGHTLTAISDPAETTGLFGGGVALDGNDAYSAVNHADFQPTENFSVGCWVKTTSTSFARLFHSRSVLSIYNGIALYMWPDGKITLRSGKNVSGEEGTGYKTVNSIHAVNNGAWQFVVATWDGSYLRVYVNGELDASPVAWAYAPVYPTTSYVRVGCSCDQGINDYYFIGSLDDVFLFKGKALSADEIADLAFESRDASLNLSTYYQKLADFETYLRAHNGLEFRDFQTIFETISASQITIDAILNMEAKGQKFESFMTYLYAAKEQYKDFATYLSVTDGNILRDFAAFLAATDGNVLKDMSVYLQAIGAIPAFRSVTAHRVSSVIHEVV